VRSSSITKIFTFSCNKRSIQNLLFRSNNTNLPRSHNNGSSSDKEKNCRKLLPRSKKQDKDMLLASDTDVVKEIKSAISQHSGEAWALLDTFQGRGG
ncbi:hypothetical protein CDAR_460861, partial [Caerostris darwini]